MDDWNTPREEKYLGLTPAQFNLVFFAVAGAVGLAIAVYFGALGAVGDFFGGDGSPSVPSAVEKAAPTPDGEEGDAPAVSAEEAANAAVLKLDDVPSGWTKDASGGDDEDDDDDFQLTGECAIFNEDTFPGELASAESEDFEGPAGQQVSSSASAFADEAVAQEAFDTLDSALTTCGDQLVAAFEEGALEAGGEADVSLEKLAFPAVGDATSAHRIAGTMTVEGVTIPFVWDLVAIRAGRMAGGLSYMAFGEVNSLEEEVLAETVADKLAEANSSLAE